MRMHACTHARTHARARAHTHTLSLTAAPSRRTEPTVEEKGRLAGMQRFKKAFEMDEASVTAERQLTSKKEGIREVRETRKLLSHLRAKPLGLDLRALQRPSLLVAHTLKRDSAASLAAKVREVQADKLAAGQRRREAASAKEEERSLRREEHKMRQQLAAECIKQTRTGRPRSAALLQGAWAQARMFRQDARDFSKQMAGNINLLSSHIQRAGAVSVLAPCPCV